jgi:hypothetical protein
MSFVAQSFRSRVHLSLRRTRQEAEAKGWTLFELPEAVTAGVPDAMRSMFGE